MQVAKGPYKCVPRQLRMTCEPRSSAGTPRFCQSRTTTRVLQNPVIAALETSVRMATGQPQDACKAAAGGIPQGGANYGLTAYQRPLAGSAC